MRGRRAASVAHRARPGPLITGLIVALLLTACGGGGGGSAGGAASTTTTTTTTTPQTASIPSATNGLTATPGNSQVTLTWAANPAGENVTSYILYMASQSGVTKANYASLPDGMKHTEVTSPYTHTGLTEGKTYYLVLTALNSAGEGPVSSEVSATPQAGPSLVTWSAKPSMPTARWALAAGALNNVFYAAGGRNTDSGYLTTLEAYDPTTNTWTTKAPMPTARGYLAAGVVNGILYAVGGYTNSGCSGCYLTTLEAYNPTTDTWTTKASMPTARGELAVGVVNGILYAVGGASASAKLKSVEAYDPTTNTWTTKAPMPTARTAVAAGMVNGILYAVGGKDGSDSVLATVEAYDPTTNTWTTKAPMPTARTAVAAGVVNGILYAVGGSDGNAGLKTVEAYNPPANSWSTAASMPTARGYLAAGVLNNVLYAVGGIQNVIAPLASLEAFSP